VLLALAIAAAACSPAKPPSVVLISVDTLRADALGAYGGLLPTPSFDRFAREGVLFEKAFAPAPARRRATTLFTARTSLRHGLLVTASCCPRPTTLPRRARGACAPRPRLEPCPTRAWLARLRAPDAAPPPTPHEGASRIRALFWICSRASIDARGHHRGGVARPARPSPSSCSCTTDPHAPYVPPRHVGGLAKRRFALENRECRARPAPRALVPLHQALTSTIPRRAAEAVAALLTRRLTY
jgi:hypothetical protein